MTTVIGVRFRSSGRVYYFDPIGLDVRENDGVIVETARGTEYGTVTQAPTEVQDEEIIQPLKPIIRIATEEDTRLRNEYMAKEQDALHVCEQKIAAHNLDMKLVDVEYAFNGSKVVFYFTADERVDFRELVKDLASQFHTRIELRQIGVRDETKMLGGLGPCGRGVCCKEFLDDFRPVSIKMAKDQNLSLSPTKISGLCGRLMCCLQYEQNAYEDMKKKMPRTGKEVLTPDGIGIAIENNAVTEKTRVKLTMPDGTIDIRDYHYSCLAKPGEALPEMPERAQAPEEPAAPASGNAQYVPVEVPEAADGPRRPERRPERSNERGRRGSRKPKESGAEGGEAAKDTASAAPTTNAEPNAQSSEERKPSRRRHRGGHGHGRGKQNPEASNAEASAPTEKAPAEAAGSGSEEKPKRSSRRRRRGGSHRKPAAEGAVSSAGAPSGEEN